MVAFSTHVEQVLRNALWHPRRRVDARGWIDTLTADGFRATAAAETFLVEFGGLGLSHSGRGETCAREPFWFDPLAAIGEADRFQHCSQKLETQLFPVGEFGRGQFFIGVGDRGHVLLLGHCPLLLGADAHEALEALVRGIASRKLRDPADLR